MALTGRARGGIVGFWTSALANFVGSLVANSLVAAVVYYLVTYKLEIVRPLRERQLEQKTVCDLLARELDQFSFSVQDFSSGRFETRIQAHAWEALKGSQAMRFLPVRCLEPVLNAYSGIYTAHQWLERADLADALSWAIPGSAATALANKLRQDALKLAVVTDKDCKKAVEELRSEAQRLAPDNSRARDVRG